MKTEKFRLDDAAFNEFVYSLLHNASFEAKKAIPTKYLKLFNVEGEAKKFARRATVDEVRAVLSYLGVEHFFVFVDKKNANFKDFRRILENFKDGKNVASLKDIVDLKLFVTSDKEFITLLGLIAQTIHHKAYSMTLELTRTAYHVKQWGKHLEKQPSLEIQENSNALARTLLSSSLTLAKSAALFGLKYEDIEVLLYFYPLKHTYVSMTQLVHYFAGHFTKRQLLARTSLLVGSRHLQRSALAGQADITISALGIRTVNEFMDATLHSTSFH